MKKLFLLLLPLLVAGWLVSCTGCKEPKEVFPFGTVVEVGTQKPIPGATVLLSDCEGEVLGNTNCHVVGQTGTDSAGAFAFSRKGFSLSAKAEGYFESGDDFVVPAFDGDNTNATIVPLYPHAWLKVTIRNESGVYGLSGPQMGLANKLYLLEKNTEETFTTKLRGNIALRVVYTVFLTENNGTTALDAATIYLDDVKLQPSNANSTATWVEFTPIGHDTTSLTIIY